MGSAGRAAAAAAAPGDICVAGARPCVAASTMVGDWPETVGMAGPPPRMVSISPCRSVGVLPVRVKARRSSASSRPDW